MNFGMFDTSQLNLTMDAITDETIQVVLDELAGGSNAPLQGPQTNYERDLTTLDTVTNDGLSDFHSAHGATPGSLGMQPAFLPPHFGPTTATQQVATTHSFAPSPALRGISDGGAYSMTSPNTTAFDYPAMGGPSLVHTANSDHIRTPTPAYMESQSSQTPVPSSSHARLPTVVVTPVLEWDTDTIPQLPHDPTKPPKEGEYGLKVRIMSKPDRDWRFPKGADPLSTPPGAPLHFEGEVVVDAQDFWHQLDEYGNLEVMLFTPAQLWECLSKAFRLADETLLPRITDSDERKCSSLSLTRYVMVTNGAP